MTDTWQPPAPPGPPRTGLSTLTIVLLSISGVVALGALLLASFPLTQPYTTLEGFKREGLPTIDDLGNVDCGGSSLSVFLHGPTIAAPDTPLRRTADDACRSAARFDVAIGIVGVLVLAGLATAWGVWFVLRPSSPRRA